MDKGKSSPDLFNTNQAGHSLFDMFLKNFSVTNTALVIGGVAATVFLAHRFIKSGALSLDRVSEKSL